MPNKFSPHESGEEIIAIRSEPAGPGIIITFSVLHVLRLFSASFSDTSFSAFFFFSSSTLWLTDARTVFSSLICVLTTRMASSFLLIAAVSSAVWVFMRRTVSSCSPALTIMTVITAKLRPSNTIASFIFSARVQTQTAVETPVGPAGSLSSHAAHSLGAIGLETCSTCSTSWACPPTCFLLVSGADTHLNTHMYWQ